MEKAAAFAIISALSAVLLKQMNSSMAYYVVIFSSVGLFAYMLLKISGIFDALSKLTEYFAFDEIYMSTLFKMLGISFIGEFTSNVCTDLGYSSIAGQVQMVARLLILILTLPVVMTLLNTLEGMFFL